MHVHAGQLGVVVEHLLEVRHQPVGVGRVAVEAAAQLVVDAAGGHRVERPAGHRRAAASSPVAACRRSRNSIVIGCGNLGAPPQPPLRRVERRARAADGAASSSRGRSAPGRRTASLRLLAPTSASTSRAAGCLDLRALLAPGRADARPAPGGTTACRDAASSGKYVPAVERPAVGRQEHAHRPAAAAGHRLDGAHVDLVEVGPLLAVDLDRDEVARSGPRPSPRPRTTRAP